MIRTLSIDEVKKIEDFISKVGPEITPAQPLYNSQDDNFPDPIPSNIQARLGQLIALSNNDHLLNYLEKLNTHDNEVDILAWLDGLYEAQHNLIDSDLNDQYKLYRNFYRQAADLATKTSLYFAANALKAMAQLPYPMTLEKFFSFVKESKEAYDKQKAKDQLRHSYEYYAANTYISIEDLKAALLKHNPPPVLYRSRSEICPQNAKAISTLSPLRAHEPANAINFPPRKRHD